MYMTPSLNNAIELNVIFYTRKYEVLVLSSDFFPVQVVMFRDL